MSGSPVARPPRRPAVGLVLRPGRASEAPELTALALRSKGFWGYSASFMRAVTGELTLDAETAPRTVVAEVDGELAGFHLLLDPMPAAPVDPAAPEAPAASEASAAPATTATPVSGELDMLYVDPQFIGTGLGRLLFEDARRAAVQRGWDRMLVQADPQAQLFYERLGAVPVGERLSPSIPGRALPLLAVPLRRTAGGSVGAARAGYWR